MNVYTVTYYDHGQQGCNETVEEIVEVVAVCHDLKAVEAHILSQEPDIARKEDDAEYEAINDDAPKGKLLSSTAKKQTVTIVCTEDNDDVLGTYIIQRIKVTGKQK